MNNNVWEDKEVKHLLYNLLLKTFGFCTISVTHKYKTILDLSKVWMVGLSSLLNFLHQCMSSHVHWNILVLNINDYQIIFGLVKPDLITSQLDIAKQRTNGKQHQHHHH